MFIRVRPRWSLDPHRDGRIRPRTAKRASERDMNSEERQMIEWLFDRLGEAERQATPRDAEAERLIRDRIAARPATPYFMAQTMIVQGETLKAAQARIEELERSLREQPAAASSGGSFLGSLFGSGDGSHEPQRSPASAPAPSGYGGGGSGGGASGPWGSLSAAAPMQAAPAGGRFGGGGGGGFLAGAAQTAVGVAGGVMLGSMLGNLFEGSGHSFLGGGALGSGPGGETVVENNVTENFYGAPADTSGIDNANSDEPDIENADYDGMDMMDLDGNDDI
jgi:hypothetical protein